MYELEKVHACPVEKFHLGFHLGFHGFVWSSVNFHMDFHIEFHMDLSRFPHRFPYGFPRGEKIRLKMCDRVYGLWSQIPSHALDHRSACRCYSQKFRTYMRNTLIYYRKFSWDSIRNKNINRFCIRYKSWNRCSDELQKIEKGIVKQNSTGKMI